MPPLEAATREELQQKIQAKLVAALGVAFPGLQLPQQGTPGQRCHARRSESPVGGFSSALLTIPERPAAIRPRRRSSITTPRSCLSFVDKHFPHLSEQIASQVTGREIQVFTSRTVSTSRESRTHCSVANVSPNAAHAVD